MCDCVYNVPWGAFVADNLVRETRKYAEDDGQDIGDPRVIEENVSVGLKVVRGQDWKWGNQDGGEGGIVFSVLAN